MRLMDKEIEITIAKLAACRYGLERIYKIATDSIPETLDEIILWTRDALVRAERAIDNCYETVQVIALRQPQGPTPVLPVPKENDWEKQLATGKFQFELKREHLLVAGEARRVFLRGIGLGWDSRAILIGKYFRRPDLRLRALCTLPPHPISDQGFERSVVLGNVVFINSNAPIDMVVSPPVHNMDPIGTWEISLEPKAVGGDYKEVVLPSYIHDIKLFLRLAYVPGER
jgi:hypothetical protein